MTDPLRRRLEGAALDPSRPVDIAALEARAGRLRRRTRRGGGALAASIAAVLVIVLVLVVPGRGSDVRVTTATTGPVLLAQSAVRAAAEQQAQAALAVGYAPGPHSGMIYGGSACKETTFDTYLRASRSSPAPSTTMGDPGLLTPGTPVYVCVAQRSFQTGATKAVTSFSILYVTTVAADAAVLNGQASNPVPVADLRTPGAGPTPAWFANLADQPDLAVPGVTNHPAPPPLPPRSSKDSHYVASTYVEAAALKSLQCPVPAHLTGTSDTKLSDTTEAGPSTCTSATVQLLPSSVDATKLQLTSSGGGVPAASAVYVVTVRGRLPETGSSVTINPFTGQRLSTPYVGRYVIEYDATNGQPFLEGGSNPLSTP